MSHRIEKPSQKELEHLYYQQGSTISSVARFYNTSQPTVRKWLESYCIDKKSHHQASIEANQRNSNHQIPERDRLNDDYQTMSIDDLEQKYKVGQSTIYKWLELYEIPIIKHRDKVQTICSINRHNHLPDYQTIKQLYDNSDNIEDLARKIDRSYSYTRDVLHYYAIDIKIPKTSTVQREMFEYLQSIDNNWKLNDRSIIAPKELDIVNTTKNIAIEVCGVVWHSENFGKKNRRYHIDKWKRCRDVGYKLYTIYDCEWANQQNQLKNLLNSKKQRIFARDCKVIKQSSKEFEFDNHLARDCLNHVAYTLVYDNQIVSSMSFSSPRFNKKYQWEIVRYTVGNYTVIGGGERLFAHFIREYRPHSIISYCDNRFGDGGIYNKLGFKFIDVTEPNYKYFNFNDCSILYSRQQFQKHKLSKKLNVFDNCLSEFQNMINNNYDRIWDCGNSVFSYERSN